MPGYACPLVSLLNAVNQSCGGGRMGLPVQSKVDQNIGVEQNHRKYFFARES